MFILREKLQPESKEELIAVISGFMHRFGTNCDLNSIDVSKIKDMSELFQEKFLNQFDGDISKWNVGNVEDMRNMFTGSYFAGDISKWNVSKVKDMTEMFYRARDFNSDLSKWDVSKVETMEGMFARASSFTGDLSKWKVNSKCNVWYMFDKCPLYNNPPQWYINNLSKQESLKEYVKNFKAFEVEVLHWYDEGFRKKYDGMEPEDYILCKMIDSGVAEDFGFKDEPSGKSYDSFIKEIRYIIKE